MYKWILYKQPLHDILTMQATSGQWFSLSLKHFSNSIYEVVSKMFQKWSHYNNKNLNEKYAKGRKTHKLKIIDLQKIDQIIKNNNSFKNYCLESVNHCWYFESVLN